MGIRVSKKGRDELYSSKSNELGAISSSSVCRRLADGIGTCWSFSIVKFMYAFFRSSTFLRRSSRSINFWRYSSSCFWGYNLVFACKVKKKINLFIVLCLLQVALNCLPIQALFTHRVALSHNWRQSGGSHARLTKVTRLPERIGNGARGRLYSFGNFVRWTQLVQNGFGLYFANWMRFEWSAQMGCLNFVLIRYYEVKKLLIRSSRNQQFFLFLV